MNEISRKLKIILITSIFVLLSLTIAAFFTLMTSPTLAPGMLLSLFAGISMIFLPCTFPLVFIIVPLALSRKAGKGLVMALFFGLGLTVTFTIYGIITGWVGGYIGLSKVVRGMLFIGGVAALVFGLSDLKLIKFRLPFKQTILPLSLQKSNDYLRSFFLGFFLGNAGVGCPNPAFYILFGYVATIGSVQAGAYLGAIHGIGRVIPLLLLVSLALVGINATKTISKYQAKAKRIVAWSMVVLGSFIFNYGVFSHTWFEKSIFHKTWNIILEKLVPQIAESEKIEQVLNLPEGQFVILPWIVFALIISGVILWDAQKNKQQEKITD